MATKPRQAFSCNSCGAQTAKWAGQCPECGDWNSLTEVVGFDASTSANTAARFGGFAAAQTAQLLDSIEVDEGKRIQSGIGELDRVLGGGLVAGSVILIGGDPGIGKSTLLLQALAQVSNKQKVLYVTGEESVQQVALRAQRLDIQSATLKLLAENSIEAVFSQLQIEQPQVLVADSIQTFFTSLLQSAPGSVAQVRETAAQLVRFAKQTGCVTILVGHVTKEGNIAGPRILEHMVDAVLYFEGDRSTSFRLVRAIKNRFGAVNEIGVFAMTEKGLREVTNPSAMFITRHQAPAAGSIVLATQEGSRPLLVEIQALVDKSALANPRRLTVGLDQSRLSMLLAVLHRHAGFALYDQDVFVNAVGGVRVNEPAADLALALAVVSSLTNQPIPSDTVVFGEVGLAGEVRPVQRGLDRIREAEKLGFTRVIVPAANRPKTPSSGIQVEAVGRISEALAHLD